MNRFLSNDVILELNKVQPDANVLQMHIISHAELLFDNIDALLHDIKDPDFLNRYHDLIVEYYDEINEPLTESELEELSYYIDSIGESF